MLRKCGISSPDTQPNFCYLEDLASGEPEYLLTSLEAAIAYVLVTAHTVVPFHALDQATITYVFISHFGRKTMSTPMFVGI